MDLTATTVRECKPETGFEDALNEVLRTGAVRLLAEAIETEVVEFIERYQGLRDTNGRRLVVRNGHMPEREIQTGIGAVEIGRAHSELQSHSFISYAVFCLKKKK